MIFIKRGTYYLESECGGYTICGAANPAGGWVYTAFGPEDLPELGSYWKWLAARGKEFYKMGDPVPQRSARLGSFLDLDEAKSACIQHRDEELFNDDEQQQQAAGGA